MSDALKRLFRWVVSEKGITALCVLGLLIYLWWKYDFMFALNFAAICAFVLISAWFFARLWMVLVGAKRFSKLEGLLLAVVVALAMFLFFLMQGALFWLLAIGAVMSSPALILGIKSRSDLKRLRERKDLDD